MPIEESTRQQIAQTVGSNRVVLFMKGTRGAPQCGFSASVCGVLDTIVGDYVTVNVLADPAIREGIKEFSQWPTIPQLYIDGTFVGGADIVREMHASGELGKMLGATPKSKVVPRVRLTDTALAAIRDAAKQADGDPLRLEISPRFEYDLYFGPAQGGDVEIDLGGIVLRIDSASADRADGLVVDFVQGPGGAGFKMDNPNAPAKVRPIPPEELKAMRDRGEKFELIDVRGDKERAIAKIDWARALDADTEAHLDALPKDTLLVFVCHHGMRSQAAAEQRLAQGHRNVANLSGGIDAWSRTVDTSVPRY